MRVGVSILGLKPHQRKRIINGRFFIVDNAKEVSEIMRFMDLLSAMIGDTGNSLSKSVLVN